MCVLILGRVPRNIEQNRTTQKGFMNFVRERKHFARFVILSKETALLHPTFIPLSAFLLRGYRPSAVLDSFRTAFGLLTESMNFRTFPPSNQQAHHPSHRYNKNIGSRYKRLAISSVPLPGASKLPQVLEAKGGPICPVGVLEQVVPKGHYPLTAYPINDRRARGERKDRTVRLFAGGKHDPTKPQPPHALN